MLNKYLDYEDYLQSSQELAKEIYIELKNNIENDIKEINSDISSISTDINSKEFLNLKLQLIKKQENLKILSDYDLNKYSSFFDTELPNLDKYLRINGQKSKIKNPLNKLEKILIIGLNPSNRRDMYEDNLYIMKHKNEKPCDNNFRVRIKNKYENDKHHGRNYEDNYFEIILDIFKNNSNDYPIQHFMDRHKDYKFSNPYQLYEDKNDDVKLIPDTKIQDLWLHHRLEKKSYIVIFDDLINLKFDDEDELYDLLDIYFDTYDREELNKYINWDERELLSSKKISFEEKEILLNKIENIEMKNKYKRILKIQPLRAKIQKRLEYLQNYVRPTHIIIVGKLASDIIISKFGGGRPYTASFQSSNIRNWVYDFCSDVSGSKGDILGFTRFVTICRS
ncbi:MAG: hypothetical protein NTW25_11175 [Candidatus Kapabacteria bacterium]|nr:hypothetical protein [Candidatus Kapabacteria bacterium]